MKKGKLLQIRLTDFQHEQISEKAKTKYQSTSEYVRNKLLQPKADEIEMGMIIKDQPEISVYQRREFLKTVVWIYSKKNDPYAENRLEEAKLYTSLIDSFIMDLEPKYLEYFYSVKKDLERAVQDYNVIFGLQYKFTRSNESVYFNFKEFEKMILEDEM